jgi:hypothetical protein
MSDKTHWKKAFNKDYLGAHDLEEGQELKLTIREVIVKEIIDPQGGKEQRNVAYFTGKTKPMILNVTACKLLKKFSGSKYIEDWKGLNIQIYAAEVKAFGEITDALRIREQMPRMEKEELTPEHEKWEGAIKKYRESQDLTVVEKYFNLSDTNKQELIRAASVS